MPIPAIPIPEYYSQKIGYEVLSPLQGFLEASHSRLTAPLSVFKLREYFNMQNRLLSDIQKAVDGGQLDASLPWKTLATETISAMTQLNNFSTIAKKKYGGRVADKIKTEVDAGNDMEYDDAARILEVDTADITTLTNAIATAAGI